MITTAILAAGAAVTAAMLTVPPAAAAVATPINRRRDARRHAAETARTGEHTAGLIAQIRAGAEYAALAGSDPGKLASAAHSTAAGLAAWIAAEGHPDDAPLTERVLAEIRPVLDAEQVPVPAASTTPPIQAAAALQLLLHRLAEDCDGPQRARVATAGGAAAEVVRVLPDGCVVGFNPLTEFDPEPLRRAQAVWIDTARQAGMGGWTRAVRA